MQAEVILYIIIFLYGITIGSFLNVLILRLPEHENIITERSHCMTCNNQLKWYDLVPLFSWLVLGGRCRYCKAHISIQYPLIELINGCGYVLIFMTEKFTWLALLNCLLFSVLIVISVIDFRTYEIPVGLNIAILILGIVNTILDYRNIYDHLIGAVIVSGFMLIVLYVGRRLKGIDAFGGGDIKLMAAAGLFIGWQNIVLAFFIGCIAGAVIHPVRMRITRTGHMLAFGPYLCTGIFIAALEGTTILKWYLGFFL